MPDMMTYKLLSHHRDQLVASGITEETMLARGYYSVDDEAELLRLGFSRFQARRTPALVIPVHGIDGNVAFHQIRPDRPRTDDFGKAVKYEIPTSQKLVIDVPPKLRGALRDPAVPLFVTEGVKKADAAASNGLCCVALLGVWNWRGQNPEGGKTALADWEAVALNGREVYIAFDSDITDNPQVQLAASRLAAYLGRHRAKCSVLALPNGDGDVKVGLDDFFAGGGTVEKLLALPRLEAGQIAAEPRYVEKDDGIYLLRRTKADVVEERLANFTARILSEELMTDGVDSRGSLLIGACVSGEALKVRVALEDFERMDWVVPLLGAKAIIAAGYGLKDRLREAIQTLSGDYPRYTVYGHLGWVMHEDRWVFLHAGGYIGGGSAVARDGVTDEENAQAPSPDDRAVRNTFGSPDLHGQCPESPNSAGKTWKHEPRVRLSGPLLAYTLPEPPRGEELIHCIKASLCFLECMRVQVAWPLYAAIWRAVLGGSDFSLHLVGPTGEGKSETLALLSQHFGPGLDARHLPGSWQSTAASLQALSFLAKDVILPVDDFVPTGSKSDIERSNAQADRLFRSQGNGAGRGRCNRDGTLQDVRPPRSLIIASGETIPTGHSLVARLLTIELKRGDLLNHEDGPRKLSVLQDWGKQGLFAKAMAGYLSWLAERYDVELSEFRSHTVKYRNLYTPTGRHPRSIQAGSELLAAFDSFLCFAMDVGAVDTEHVKFNQMKLWEMANSVASEIVDRQACLQVEEDPVERYLQLLRTALRTRRAHIEPRHGEFPDTDPTAWGWASDTKAPNDDGSDNGHGPRYCRCGELIGWIDHDYVYLSPVASLAVAQELAREASQPVLPFTIRTLGRALAGAELLHHRDGDRYTTRKNFPTDAPVGGSESDAHTMTDKGRQLRVFMIGMNKFYPPEPMHLSGDERDYFVRRGLLAREDVAPTVDYSYLLED